MMYRLRYSKGQQTTNYKAFDYFNNQFFLTNNNITNNNNTLTFHKCILSEYFLNRTKKEIWKVVKVPMVTVYTFSFSISSYLQRLAILQ